MKLNLVKSTVRTYYHGNPGQNLKNHQTLSIRTTEIHDNLKLEQTET